MQVNSRALLWGGAITAIVLIMAFLVFPAVFVALGLAVCLLVALVVVNRMREAADATREADNDESTSRLGTLEGIDEEPYDSTTFDSAIFGTSRSDPLYDETPPYEPPAEDEQFEEFTQPQAEWSTDDFGSGTTFAPQDERVDEFPATYEATEYTSAFEAPAETSEFTETEFAETEFAETEPAETEFAETEFAETEPAETEFAETKPAETEFAEPEFQVYVGPSREVADFESSAVAQPLADYSLDDVDASSVLADEGVIDEAKVTTAESILAASQVSRFEPETMSDEESNEETREILGRVAALLAKYE